jgi:hypothetical protein
MTQDEVIAMARESGTGEMGLNVDGSIHLLGLFTRFAALVAAKEREAFVVSIRSAIQAGRYHFADPQKRDVSDRVLMDLLDSIRARGDA